MFSLRIAFYFLTRFNGNYLYGDHFSSFSLKAPVVKLDGLREGNNLCNPAWAAPVKLEIARKHFRSRRNFVYRRMCVVIAQE